MKDLKQKDFEEYQKRLKEHLSKEDKKIREERELNLMIFLENNKKKELNNV